MKRQLLQPSWQTKLLKPVILSLTPCQQKPLAMLIKMGNSEQMGGNPHGNLTRLLILLA